MTIEDVFTGAEAMGRPIYQSEFQPLLDIIKTEPNPEKHEIDKSPFNYFVIIDGHRGHHVAQVIKKYLPEIIYRNKNIMVKRRYCKGLKEVIIKMEEMLGTQ